MKKMILSALLALAVAAGIASAGIASLASGVAILINAASHSIPHDHAARGLDGSRAGGGADG